MQILSSHLPWWGWLACSFVAFVIALLAFLSQPSAARLVSRALHSSTSGGGGSPDGFGVSASPIKSGDSLAESEESSKTRTCTCQREMRKHNPAAVLHYTIDPKRVNNSSIERQGREPIALCGETECGSPKHYHRTLLDYAPCVSPCRERHRRGIRERLTQEPPSRKILQSQSWRSLTWCCCQK